MSCGVGALAVAVTVSFDIEGIEKRSLRYRGPRTLLGLSHFR
jgi:hypothetical protein